MLSVLAFCIECESWLLFDPIFSPITSRMSFSMSVQVLCVPSNRHFELCARTLLSSNTSVVFFIRQVSLIIFWPGPHLATCPACSVNNLNTCNAMSTSTTCRSHPHDVMLGDRQIFVFSHVSWHTSYICNSCFMRTIQLGVY